MKGFTKLYSTILSSSVWAESDRVRIIWITLLALCDATGYVETSLPGLAHLARKSRVETVEAIRVLSSPDADSKNPDHDGRRIRKVEGGWLVLNYCLYRARHELSDEPEAIATRERVRRYRERKCVERYKALPPVTSASASPFPSPSASVRTLGGGHRGPANTARIPALPDLQTYAQEIGLDTAEASKFLDFYRSNGWRIGRNPMRDWRAALRNWQRRCADNNIVAPRHKRQAWQVESEIVTATKQRQRTWEHLRRAVSEHLGAATSDELDKRWREFGKPPDVKLYDQLGEKLRQLRDELTAALRP